MSETKQVFPPNVVLYITAEIARRTQYKTELEMVPQYQGSDRFTKQRNLEKTMTYRLAIDRITADVISTTRKHLPSIEIDQNDEITISNILAAMPPPEQLIVKKIYHGGA